MRFGIFIPQGWRHDLVDIDPAEHWPTMRRLAHAADSGPWESLWVYDHFHTVPVPSEEATHEAWSLMAAFAAVTDRIRLGQMCTCMGYRNPAYLAKVAATIDHVSSGRIEMGIGGGWYEHEWRAYGYGYPTVGERLARLDEGVQVMKQAWEQGAATFDGRHYRFDGAIVRPLPIQRPGIPIWIAGGGEKVTLRIAAQYADYTNWTGALEPFVWKSKVLQSHCAAVGTDFDRIVRSANYSTIVGDSDDDVRQRIDRLEQRMTPYLGGAGAAEYVSEYRDESAFCGTPDQLVARLEQMGSHGLAYSIHYFPEVAYDRSGIELFEHEVIPRLR